MKYLSSRSVKKSLSESLKSTFRGFWMKYFLLGVVKKSSSEFLKPVPWGFYVKNFSGAMSNKREGVIVRDPQFADTLWSGRRRWIVSLNFKMRVF